MNPELYVIASVGVLAAFYFLVPPVLGTFIKFRGKRVITCPETREPAAVEVDTGHAALTALVGDPDLKLKSCSRWPEREDCGQECLLQIELAPYDCLARTMLEDWYHGKTCVLCRLKFQNIGWSDHKPAMLSPEGSIVEWRDVPAEQLPDLFKTHQPVCWACAVTRSLMQSHPQVVVDRSRISAPIVRQG
ncbi:MAG TPA: hypothetical protein VNS63_12970 [Blastocatellia bacterium]|nr:hypothetical protein [Blastocatellia bacterium]